MLAMDNTTYPVRNKSSFTIENILSKPNFIDRRKIDEIETLNKPCDNDRTEDFNNISNTIDDPVNNKSASDTNSDFESASDSKKQSNKRPRTAFSAAQIKTLESEFEKGKYLSVAKRTSLAKTLHLTETQIKIWYQNRRTKWKRKYTSDVESLASHYYSQLGIGALARPMVIGDRLWLFSQTANFQNQNPAPTTTPFQSLLVNNSVIPPSMPRTFSHEPQSELTARNLLYHQRASGYNLNTSLDTNKTMFQNYSINSSFSKQIQDIGPNDNGLADLERVFGTNSCILNEQSTTKSSSSEDIDCEEIADDI